MNLKRTLFFLVGGALVLLLFALVWGWLAPSYARLQILFARPCVVPQLHFTVDDAGIAVSEGDRSLVRRDFTSFGGLGLTLALWLCTPGLAWKRRLLFTILGLVALFFLHVGVLLGLIAFAQAVESGRAGGFYTLLYGFLAVSDWVVPILFWGLVSLRYRAPGATP